MRQHAARDEIINSAVPPCFMVKPYPCRDTNISPATDVCPHVAEYLPHGFPCALSGPFDDLFFICISASQTLCRSIIAVISASTVCNLIFRYSSRMLRGCQAGFSVIIRFNSRLTLNVFSPCTRQASASVSAPAAAQPKQCIPRLDKKSCVSGYIFAISPIRFAADRSLFVLEIFHISVSSPPRRYRGFFQSIPVRSSKVNAQFIFHLTTFSVLVHNNIALEEANSKAHSKGGFFS